MGERHIASPAGVGARRRHNAPSWALALLEIPRALSEATSLIPARSILNNVEPGDGHAVMTLPGFLASGRSMRLVRRYLRKWGYNAYCWDMGRNLGLRHEFDLEAMLTARLKELNDSSGRRVSLVGWSLGGLFARELARRHPECIRSVITMGSPIGNPKATNAWRLYEQVSGTRVDDAYIRHRVKSVREPIDGVPMTAIFSHSDAIVSSDIAMLPPGPLVENVGVLASHIGMGYNPSVLYAIADRLVQTPETWEPFDMSGLRKLFYHY